MSELCGSSERRSFSLSHFPSLSNLLVSFTLFTVTQIIHLVNTVSLILLSTVFRALSWCLLLSLTARKEFQVREDCFFFYIGEYYRDKRVATVLKSRRAKPAFSRRHGRSTTTSVRSMSSASRHVSAVSSARDHIGRISRHLSVPRGREWERSSRAYRNQALRRNRRVPVQRATLQPVRCKLTA